jgi:hypothetical protein
MHDREIAGILEIFAFLGNFVLTSLHENIQGSKPRQLMFSNNSGGWTGYA